MLKLLIDECLSPDLVQMARDAGYPESNHVTWLGLGGQKDWVLMRFVLENNWTLVTNNAIDFRGPSHNPGEQGLHSKTEIHAGLVCLNWDNAIAGIRVHQASFNLALAELGRIGDLTNKCLDIFVDEDWSAEISFYDLPAL